VVVGEMLGSLGKQICCAHREDKMKHNKVYVYSIIWEEWIMDIGDISFSFSYSIYSSNSFIGGSSCSQMNNRNMSLSFNINYAHSIW